MNRSSFLSCSEKPDMLFYCCVFNEVFRFFALLRPLWSKLVLLTGSSHYSNFQGTHRDAKSCRMFFPAENCTEYLFVRSYTRSVLYMLSVQRIPSETHPRQAAEFVFSFRMITMLCFAWSFNISHIFALSSRFFEFFQFFSTCFIRQDFLSKSIMFFAWSFNISRFLHLSNALLRIFQTFFEKLLEEHRAFLQKS